MIDVEQATELPPAREAPTLHAGFWRRVAAYVIDGIALDVVIYAFWLILILIFWLSGHDFNFGSGDFYSGDSVDPFAGALFGVLYLGTIALVWLYFALFESSRLQATPGKMALGLVVTDEYGKRIGFGRATGRYFAKILSSLIFCIGYMMAGWTERKQALHDMLAGTCVVHKQALRSLQVGDRTQSRGYRPPAWVVGLIVGAAVIVPLAIIGAAIAISIPMMRSYVNRAQVAESIGLMRDARTLLDNYHEQYSRWPTATRIEYFNRKMARNAPIGKYTRLIRITRCTGKACVVAAIMKQGLDDKSIAGKSVELWTFDAGETWHCGPGGKNPIATHELPATCRDLVAPSLLRP
ncbi:MAG: RDD family protein [Gammaproteobacteria bacterium]